MLTGSGQWHDLPHLATLSCRLRMLALVGAALIVGGCGPQARPATSTPPAASVAPVDTTPQTVGGRGYLEGHASIGPLQPVERVGVPPPTPSPATCTARGLIVIDLHSGTDVARFDLDPDCTYHVALAPGTYRVELQRRGIDISKDLPQTVTISTGNTTRLDISIDTGIR